jgi:hypothetical protein
VDELLRQVAAHLALHDVELLGVEARGLAGGAVALLPAVRRRGADLLLLGEGDEEAAHDKRALSLRERPLVVPEPVCEVVLGQLLQVRLKSPYGARVVGWHRAASRAGASSARCHRPEGCRPLRPASATEESARASPSAVRRARARPPVTQRLLQISDPGS